MTEENLKESASENTDSGESESKGPAPIFLISYPKIVFLYPTVLAAMFGAVFMWFNQIDATDNLAVIPGRVFLTVLMINLVVIAFDFPRTTSLTWFFAIVAGGIGIWTFFRLNPGMVGSVSHTMDAIRPAANASFYVIFSLGMICMFIAVVISRRFDYWEVRGNELLHHHGVLSDLERFSAPNLRIDKEINDIFEYLLLRSGRLILHPSQERRAIVLENVFFINQKEERITKMLGALQVRVRTEQH